MGEKIIWEESAKADLCAIDQVTARRLLHALARMIQTGEGDVKRLQGIEPPEFRLRVGEYRLRFHKLRGVVEITGVTHRRDAYR